MRVKLLSPHVIDNTLYLKDHVLDISIVTPLMEGLDLEARAAIDLEKVRVFGVYAGRWPHLRLVDDPPIVRPLDNNRPVPPFTQGGPR